MPSLYNGPLCPGLYARIIRRYISNTYTHVADHDLPFSIVIINFTYDLSPESVPDVQSLGTPRMPVASEA